MKQFYLFRDTFKLYGIFGTLHDENQKPLFQTLEHAYKNGNDVWEALIPEGTYTCVRRRSPHFGYDLFMLKDVAGHDFIEIHRGNFNNDSKGCILLGMSRGEIMIKDSEKAFDAFMESLDGVGEIQLTVA